MTTTPLDRILAAAGSLIMRDGYSGVSIDTVAAESNLQPTDVTELFDNANDILVSMLNREFTLMYSDIVNHIERDPRGGLLSRIYEYTLSAVYERPLAKTLFVIDRDALNAIMRNSHSFSYVPQLGVRTEMIEKLQSAGMVRPDVDARSVSVLISTYSAGLAITAPHDDLDMVIRSFTDLLARSVDMRVENTDPGKRAYFDWATSLTLPKSSGSAQSPGA